MDSLLRKLRREEDDNDRESHTLSNRGRGRDNRRCGLRRGRGGVRRVGKGPRGIPQSPKSITGASSSAIKEYSGKGENMNQIEGESRSIGAALSEGGSIDGSFGSLVLRWNFHNVYLIICS